MLALGRRVGEPHGHRRPPAVSRGEPNLGADDEIFDVGGHVPRQLEHVGQRRVRVPRRDGQPVPEPTVELDFSDRADAKAEPERADPHEVAGQTRGRKHAAGVVEAGLDQDVAGGNRLRIFGHQGARLRAHRRRPSWTIRHQHTHVIHATASCPLLEPAPIRIVRRLSMRIVTGPSLTSYTTM